MSSLAPTACLILLCQYRNANFKIKFAFKDLQAKLAFLAERMLGGSHLLDGVISSQWWLEELSRYMQEQHNNNGNLPRRGKQEEGNKLCLNKCASDMTAEIMFLSLARGKTLKGKFLDYNKAEIFFWNWMVQCNVITHRKAKRENEVWSLTPLLCYVKKIECAFL